MPRGRVAKRSHAQMSASDAAAATAQAALSTSTRQRTRSSPALAADDGSHDDDVQIIERPPVVVDLSDHPEADDTDNAGGTDNTAAAHVAQHGAIGNSAAVTPTVNNGFKAAWAALNARADAEVPVDESGINFISDDNVTEADSDEECDTDPESVHGDTEGTSEEGGYQSVSHSENEAPTEGEGEDESDAEDGDESSSVEGDSDEEDDYEEDDYYAFSGGYGPWGPSWPHLNTGWMPDPYDRVEHDRERGQAGRCWAEQDSGVCTKPHCSFLHFKEQGGAAAAAYAEAMAAGAS